MKQYQIFTTFLLLMNMAFAQVITTEPPYATENDSIVIYFDATLGNSGLQDYSNDVYAHTGVLTNLSTSSSDWRYVITPWPSLTNGAVANTNKNRLTRVGADLYKLVIGNPREFYVSHEDGATVQHDESILKLAFVFRSADGNTTGRDVGGEDIFFTMYEPGLTALFVQPAVDDRFGDAQRSPVFMDPGESLDIIVSAAALGTEIDSIVLKSEGETLASTTDDSLFYTFEPGIDQAGNNLLSAVVFGSPAIQDTVSAFIMVNPESNLIALPAGRQDGINYESATSVTLSLFAPYKDFVYLIGDFNDWMVDENYLMNKASVITDTTRYWITIEGLSPGTEYAFQYFVDGELRIADPYADKLLDPSNDQWIEETTYPNLKDYPEGKTDQIVSVLQTAQVDYEWQVVDFQKPVQHELVIYELLLRDFLETHDFATLIDTLDYLQNLGISAIELMPVNEFEGNESWGYNTSFYFAPDKYYGPKVDFKRFVDACHSRGIAVIMDMVLNHSFGQSPFVQMYLDYYAADEIVMRIPNPWFNRTSPNRSFYWGADFNHESPATQKLVDRVNQYWLTEYNIDGFRFDFTKGYTNTPGDGGAYDALRINILKRMADKIWETDSTAYVILEHFADNEEEEILADYGMMLWGNTNYNYNEATMGWISGSDFSWGYYETRGWEFPHLVTYMESHDEERLMYKNLEYGNSAGDYDIQELSTALNRQKMAGAFFFTLPGPKMIWQFGELGYDYSIDYNGRVGNKPIRWDYLQDEDRNKLYKTWAALLKLRNENEIFTSKESIITLDLDNTVKKISYTHNMNVRIVGNFGVTSQETNPGFPYSGEWYDYFSGDTLVAGSGDIIALKPGEFHIYTDDKLETPEDGLITSLSNQLSEVPTSFSLSQNYPNPFNPLTKISYQLAEKSNVSLILYNTLGQKVRELVKAKQAAGLYEFTLDAGRLSSGVYFYQLRAGRFEQTRKMLLMR